MQLINNSNSSNNQTGATQREQGFLVPILSTPSGTDTQSVGVVTEEGLFAIPNGVRGDVQQNALAQFKPEHFGGMTEADLMATGSADEDGESEEIVLWHEEAQPVQVELSMQDIYYEGRSIGRRSRYDAGVYDPFGPNPGNILLVMDLGSQLALTNRNPGNSATNSNAHGAMFVQNMVKDMAEQGLHQGGQPYLMFLNVLYGDSVEVDYSTMGMEPVEGSEKAHAVRFLGNKIEESYTQYVSGGRKASAAASSGGNGPSSGGNSSGNGRAGSDGKSRYQRA